MRFWPVWAYSCPRISKRMTTGSLPSQATIPMIPRKNSAPTTTRVRFGSEELPARAKTAMSEARAERIPMRDREKTSAVKMTTARKSKPTRGSSSGADKRLRVFASLRRAARRSEAKTRSLLSAPELLPLVGLLFLADVIFTALVFSRSRMGILSALASLMAVLALAGSSSLSKRTQAVVAALFFLGIIGIVAWLGSDPVVMRFEILGQEYAQTGQNRISIWRDTLNLIHQHPLLGTGLGTFSVAYTSVQTAFLNHLVDHAHCDYLEVVSELGVPGGILMFGSIFWILARAVRRYRKAEDRFDTAVCLGCIGSITAILVHSLADFNLYIPANALVFTVTLALAWMGS